MLEEAIKENTATMKQLIAALTAGAIAAVPGKPAPKAADKPPAPAAQGQGAAAGSALDYEKDVKPLALRVAKEKGREKLVEILGVFKVAQANLLKPEQFNEFVKSCNTALTA